MRSELTNQLQENFIASPAGEVKLTFAIERMFMRPFLFIGAVIFILYLFLPGSEIAHAPGVLAPDEPVQRELFTASLREKNGYRITSVATFDIRARVIAAARYHFGREADLSPVDLVLGWGAMSDSNILKQISFSQSGRAYTWWTKALPIPRDMIESHSANMHMIPVNSEIEKQLKSIRPGNMVHLKGLLVEVISKEGWRWKSSLTRTDTGGGTCELIWVESLFVW